MSSVPTLNDALPATPGAQPGPLRILCVEDDRTYFFLIREFLLRAPFEKALEITHCATLEEALTSMRRAGDGPAFDVVMLDLNLPDSFGSETFDRLHEAKPDMPIIVLTGNDDNALAVAMVQRGAQDYMPKDDLTSNLLCRSILYALERNRLRCDLTRLNAKLLETTEDLRTTQMQLMQAEKLDSLGRIAASVAHEVKNPLNILSMGVAYFGNQRAEFGEPACSVLDSMQEAVDRAARIVDEMHTLSRSEAVPMAPCSVNQLIHNALHVVQMHLTKQRIRIVEGLASNLPDVLADPGQLSQVIVNLIMNAVQAVPAGGTIEVRTSLSVLQTIPRDEGLREFERFRTGDHVIVTEVRDHGPGIPEELMSKIFEPFFTTKPTGVGTGLGLSVSKKIIELHRGHLEIANVNNPRGLCARILLKAVGESEHMDAGPANDPRAAAEYPA